ncbi:4-carboxymuconolactone decarboxylase [Streptomyces oceani]|uniref:4-carboxymuconolactone decarboxylase n=1 Tax=Streptomyces oceani TaxID=1075402 RepID=A0A1E7JWW7_9ACTN|nr:4-carboxymuconolactone decarboxylase [Streptomyces oceani]
MGLPAWLFVGAAGLVTGTEAPRLFRTLGRHRRLFWGWLHFAGRLMPGGTLPRRHSELVILRVAHLRDCRYEFDHHVRLGRRAGVTAADARRVREGPDATEWTERERVLLTATDQLVRDSDLDDETWAALRRQLDEPTAVEFCLLVGHYTMLATVITTLRVPADRPRRGVRRIRRRRSG